jgi:hypothetical protein
MPDYIQMTKIGHLKTVMPKTVLFVTNSNNKCLSTYFLEIKVTAIDGLTHSVIFY